MRRDRLAGTKEGDAAVARMHEYDLIADWYASDRTQSTGLPEVLDLIASFEPGASVLDVGCGNGLPLTRALIDAGCAVFGIDSSAKMLERFRVNCPETPTQCATIQTFDFGGRTFDAVLAWGVLFHLTHDDQELAISRVAQILNPRGRFLFTSGDVHGSIEGQMNGVTFTYFSFTVEEYRRLLEEHGLTLLDMHQDAGANSYYLAQKRD